MHTLTNDSHQGDTAQIRVIRAEHEGSVKGQLTGQFERHSGAILPSLRPIEGNSIASAASAAFKAWILVHRQIINLFKLIENKFIYAEGEGICDNLREIAIEKIPGNRNWSAT